MADSYANRPTLPVPDYMPWLQNMYDSLGLQDDTGFDMVETQKGGTNLLQLLRNNGISDTAIADITGELKQYGITNLDRQYGIDSATAQDLVNRARYVQEYQGYRDSAGTDQQERYQRSVRNLGLTLQSAQETPGSMEAVQREGLAGVGKLKQYQLLRNLTASGKDINAMSNEELAKELGAKSITDADRSAFASLASSDSFRQFNDIQTTIDKSLEIQRQNLETYQQKLAEINAPGYADKFINESFKPQELALDQFYMPQGGAAVSEADVMRGDQESSLGRSGYDRVSAEANRQRGMAYERLGADKSAARANIQQAIDMQNPAAAAEFGNKIGQGALGLRDSLRSSLLAPYNMVYSTLGQSYQNNLIPYTQGQMAPSNPEWYDYALAAAPAVAQIGSTALTGFSTGGGSNGYVRPGTPSRSNT